MADKSKIEWTDATWNPVTGCAVVSPGCTNCYAMKLAGTRLQHHSSREGLTTMSKAGPVWNGQVRLNEEWIRQPLNWKRPRKVFVCAHGDLFFEGVPDEWIDRVFAAMAVSGRHTYQVLTKRPQRMREVVARIGRSIDTLERHAREFGYTLKFEGRGLVPWPLPNVWLGVSAERQHEADERIPLLLQTPAAVRFISAEPLLGPIDLRGIEAPDKVEGEHWVFDALATGDIYYQRFERVLEPSLWEPGDGPYRDHAIDWVIVGGESGPNARPMHPQWARDIRDQCEDAGVPYFFKQWGGWKDGSDFSADAEIVLSDGRHFDKSHSMLDIDRLVDGVSRLNPTMMRRVGKKAAGRLLDGVEHNGFPCHQRREVAA